MDKDRKISLGGGRRLVFGRTLVMGILNLTKDSFFPASRVGCVADAVEKAETMVLEGADILDIGAESTRPGALAVPEDREAAALIPVVEAIRRVLPEVPISVDTRRANTARRSLEAGADIVNDVSGLELPGESTRMIELLSESAAPYVLTHTKGTPDVMQTLPSYDDFMKELLYFFEEKISALTKAGVSEDRIIIDPGVGFGKRDCDNLGLLANLRLLKKFGRPVLIGASRKGFIGRILETAGIAHSNAPEDRLEGTLALSALCSMESIEIIRVHDVRENRRVVEVTEAIKRQRS
jgi:dihydropteroate synthase